MAVLDAVRCFFLLYTEKSMSRNTQSQCNGGGELSEMLLYLIVTGVNSIMVVTLSRNAERMDAMRQRMMIMGHTLPLDS